MYDFEPHELGRQVMMYMLKHYEFDVYGKPVPKKCNTCRGMIHKGPCKLNFMVRYA